MNAITEPEHYSGPIECIDAIRAALGDASFIDYCRANALKYLWRAGRKGDALEDFQKARVYLLFAENAYLGGGTKDHLECESMPANDCEDCRAQAQAILANLEDRLEAQQEATRKTVANMQAKIDRQRAQLRSRGGHLTLIPEIQAWQRETFPDADVFDYISKLREEIMEMEAAMDGADFSNPVEELADIAICLIGLAQAMGIPLLPAIAAKFEINKGRTWAKDHNGNYHHEGI